MTPSSQMSHYEIITVDLCFINHNIQNQYVSLLVINYFILTCTPNFSRGSADGSYAYICFRNGARLHTVCNKSQAPLKLEHNKSHAVSFPLPMFLLYCFPFQSPFFLSLQSFPLISFSCFIRFIENKSELLIKTGWVGHQPFSTTDLHLIFCFEIRA